MVIPAAWLTLITRWFSLRRVFSGTLSTSNRRCFLRQIFRFHRKVNRFLLRSLRNPCLRRLGRLLHIRFYRHLRRRILAPLLGVNFPRRCSLRIPRIRNRHILLRRGLLNHLRRKSLLRLRSRHSISAFIVAPIFLRCRSMNASVRNSTMSTERKRTFFHCSRITASTPFA